MIKIDILISIIVPIYNVKKYLKRCINSLINQTYRNIEIILVDDGSTDGSEKICDKFAKIDNRVKVIHQKNQGVSIARNSGILNSKGEYIMFVDPDDWIDKKCCKVILKYLHNDIDFLAFNFIKIYKTYKSINYKDNSTYKYIKFNRFDKNILMLNVLGYSNNLSDFNTNYVLGKVYKRNFILKNKIYFNKNLKIGEDQLFNLYVYKNMKSGIGISYKGYYYFYNNSSVTRRFIFDRLKIDKNFLDELKKFIIRFNLADINKAYYYTVMRGLVICLNEWFCNKQNNLNYMVKRRYMINHINNYPYINVYNNYYNMIKDKLSLKNKIILKLCFNGYLEIVYILYKIKDFLNRFLLKFRVISLDL